MSSDRQQDGTLASTFSAPQIELLARRLGEIPTLTGPSARAIAADALAGDGAAEAAAREFIEIVSADPALTVALLIAANAAKAQSAATAADAVAQLGLAAARSAVIALPAEAPSAAGPQVRQGFWLHFIATALAAQAVAREAGLDERLAFACGLLHDIGKIAFAQALPKAYARIIETVAAQGGDIAAVERELLGADHCMLAHRLAQQWRLPAVLTDVLWLHHQPPGGGLDLPAPHVRMIAAVRLADTIARKTAIGFSGNFTFPEPAAQQAQRLGLSAAALEQIETQLASRVQERSEILGLAAGEGEGVTAQALKQINRLNDRLERQCQSLSARAVAFDHLQRFIESLSPQASVEDVLGAIAAGAAAALGSDDQTAAVAYSLVDGGQDILAVRQPGPAGARSLVSFVAPELNPPPPRSAAAAEAMAEILADPTDVGDWIDLSKYSHRPLVCAGRWIGGVLIPAASGTDAPVEALLTAMAVALAIVQSRCQAVGLSEQLAAATQTLAATQDALAEGKAQAAVGEMAGGAAHEINNPLAVISGRAQLMCHKVTDEKDRKIWQTIAEQAQRISDIITDLMDYASPPPPQRSAVELGELLKSAAECFAKSEHPQAAAAMVDISVAEAAGAALVDAEQMVSVLSELVSNAATAGGPRVRIRMSARADEVNGWPLIAVADNGPGMDAPTQAAAFTPFFSQQQAGRRRGMGLPRAKRYVENNGGRIWIRSEANKGTTVYVQLPPAK